MKTLKQFYRELQAWIDAGCPEHDVFERDSGLCDNLDVWGDGPPAALTQLGASFVDAGLDPLFPFNKGDGHQFDDEKNCYQNPARIAWIKEHAA